MADSNYQMQNNGTCRILLGIIFGSFAMFLVSCNAAYAQQPLLLTKSLIMGATLLDEDWESYSSTVDVFGVGGWVHSTYGNTTQTLGTYTGTGHAGGISPTKVLYCNDGDGNAVRLFPATIASDSDPLVVDVWMYDEGGTNNFKGISLIRTNDGGLTQSGRICIHRFTDKGAYWRLRGDGLTTEQFVGPGMGPGWRRIIITVRSNSCTVTINGYSAGMSSGYSFVPSGGWNAVALGYENNSAYTEGEAFFDEVLVYTGSAPTATPSPMPTDTPLPADLIVDNLDARYTDHEGDSPWASSTATAGFYASDYRYNLAGTGLDTATWTALITEPGVYDVSVWYTAGANRPLNAPYTIHYSGGSQTVLVNQKTGGGQWNLLGSFAFDSGENSVVLTDQAESGTVVVADAIRWQRQSITATPTSTPTPTYPPQDGSYPRLGSWLELFVDDAMIESASAVSLQLNSPEPREVVITFDAPWEGSNSAYVTVFKDGDLYRMYYRGNTPGNPQVACYAESTDGITFTKPNIGIFNFGGNTNNNIILVDEGTHCFAPFKDENPDAPAMERYKAVSRGDGGLIAFCSPDGIHWSKLQDAPIITQGAFDSQNTACWDPVGQQYVANIRTFELGYRTVSRSTSTDFRNWTTPQFWTYGDTPREHLYTNAALPYYRAPQFWLALPMRWERDRLTIWEDDTPIDGVSDGVFLSSRDGHNWDRRFMEGFIRAGLDPLNWGNSHANNAPVWGIVPTGDNDMSLYWMEHFGASIPMGAPEEQNTTALLADSGTAPRIRRGVLKPDGFVSVHAGYQTGEFTTKPLIFTGYEMIINYETSAVGTINVEFQDVEGLPIPGFTLADCVDTYGDELERPILWQRGLGVTTNVSALSGMPVKIRFVMNDADLYSIRFSESETVTPEPTLTPTDTPPTETPTPTETETPTETPTPPESQISVWQVY